MDSSIVFSHGRYNPDRDLRAVVPTDVLDICDAFSNGHIPENVVAPDAEYDNNDIPASIIGRPSNQFDAVHLSETVKSLSSDASKSEVE